MCFPFSGGTRSITYSPMTENEPVEVNFIHPILYIYGYHSFLPIDAYF